MKTLMATILAVGGAFAHADLLLEPYVGYHTGDLKRPGFDADFNGTTIGARIGYQQLGAMVGVDYFTGMWDDDANPSGDDTPSVFGIFAGYNFPVLLRAYAGYNFMTDLKREAGGGSTKYEGSSIKLGVQTTILPFVAVGLEYWTAEFDEADGNSLSPELEGKGIGLIVSLPMTF